jgi:anti-sigma-K factor RskA
MKMRDDHYLDRERFTALAETYGADLRRWPVRERAAAEALLARDRTGARAILSRHGDLDAQLDAYSVPAPSAALIARILATAPQPALLWSRARLWWSGLGLAGIGLAGAATGALALTVATPAVVDHHAVGFPDNQTIFDDIDLEWQADD